MRCPQSKGTAQCKPAAHRAATESLLQTQLKRNKPPTTISHDFTPVFTAMVTAQNNTFSAWIQLGHLKLRCTERPLASSCFIFWG